MQTEEVIESFVEPLYLNVSGHEIDRLRGQIRKFLETPAEVEEDRYIVGVFGNGYELCLDAGYDPYEQMAQDPYFGRILGDAGPDCASSVIDIAAEEYCLREARPIKDPKGEMVDSDPNTDILSAGLLWLYYNSGKARKRPGWILYLGQFAYHTLDKRKRTVFCGLWRKRGAGQVG